MKFKVDYSVDVDSSTPTLSVTVADDGDVALDSLIGGLLKSNDNIDYIVIRVNK